MNGAARNCFQILYICVCLCVCVCVCASSDQSYPTSWRCKFNALVMTYTGDKSVRVNLIVLLILKIMKTNTYLYITYSKTIIRLPSTQKLQEIVTLFIT